jgi:hypothetical protein
MRPHYTPPQHPPIRIPPVPTNDPQLAALALVHGSSCICHTCQRRFEGLTHETSPQTCSVGR